MFQRYAICVLVAAAAVLNPTVLAEGQEPRGSRADYQVSRATSAIEIDGILDEQAWQDATRVPLQYEWFPGDNAPPPVETEAFITFDERNFYVAFRAYDPDPATIRANLMDRDSIATFVQDDHVGVMIDTFNDERRAFQFRINPLGVQADAIFSQVEFVEDFSWDIIWHSAGRITDFGYVVEIAIPLNQIRFPSGVGEATWGVEFSRSWPRSRRHRISANPRDRNNNCLLCQMTKIHGFSGLQAGRNLEVVPTITSIRTDEISSFPAGSLVGGSTEFEPGVSARWGITPSITLNAAINPDFSQVEADAAQLNVNERFALFFEEKRPFFLEGVDFFATPLNAVFTRTVVNPEWGLKLTGKQGRSAGGIFVTRDEVNSLIIPSNQRSAFAFLDESVLASVLRYRRDIGESSTVGILLTDREGDDYHNRVGGLDGFFRLSATDELRVQYLRSDTRYPAELATAFGQSTDSFAGNALRLDYQHNARDWRWGARYDDLDEGFRADSGFIPRVDLRTLRGNIFRTFWAEPGRNWTNWGVGGGALRTENHAGELTDETLALEGNFLGPRQSVVAVALQNRAERFLDTLYEDMFRAQFFFEIQPGAIGKFSLFADAGETIDFSNNRPADLLLLVPAMELKLGRHVNARMQHVMQRLDVEGGKLSEAGLTQLRLVYNFSVRSFIRGVLQYQDVERNPALYDTPVPGSSEQLFSQLLFSYKLNPQTVFFLGYSDTHFGVGQIDLTQTDRTFFAKIGYAWIF
jgi:hypothetical protein